MNSPLTVVWGKFSDIFSLWGKELVKSPAQKEEEDGKDEGD